MNVKQKRSRNNQFALRLSDSELALWNKKQSASGMNKTAFFIQMLKAATIKVQPNGQWIKSIKFKLPIIEEDISLCLDNDKQTECIILLTKSK